MPTVIANYFNGLPQFLRFLLIGGVNTAFGYSLFGILYLLTGHPTFAVVAATVVGVIFNFTGSKYFVFRRA